MRFTAAVLFAGVALAAQHGGAYTTVTDVETVTSCAPEVTNCPARQHTSTTTTTVSSAKPLGNYGSYGKNTTSAQATTTAQATKSYPTGVWDDCECDDEDTCTSASNTWATGGWSSQPTGAGSGYGNGNYGGSSGSGSSGSGSSGSSGSGNYGGSSGSSGNGSVSTSSPTGIVTAGASAAAPALLAIAAGFVAFLA